MIVASAISHFAGLRIASAIGCWIWALMQARMIIVYRGKIDSPTTGFHRGGEPNVVMSSIAIRSAATFALFGVLFLVIAWPRVLTYITGTWTCRAVLDLFFCRLGFGQYSVTAALLTDTDKGRRGYLLQESAKIMGNGLWFGACIYFFGF